jgi:hypothetical protein
MTESRLPKPALDYSTFTQILETYYPELREAYGAQPTPIATTQEPADAPSLARARARRCYPETDSNICPRPPSRIAHQQRLFERRNDVYNLATQAAAYFRRLKDPPDQVITLLETLAKRLNACSETCFVLEQTTDPNHLAPLVAACNSRFCPPCAIRRTAARSQALALATQKPHVGTLTHCVLTVPSVPAHDLLKTTRAMRSALRQLRGGGHGNAQAPAPWDEVRGGAWSLEVTHNPKTNLTHPHFHMLLDAPFIPQKAATQAWAAACAGQGIHARSWNVWLQKVNPDPASQTAAIVEVSKYISKPFSAEDTPPHFLAGLLFALHHQRTCDSWGTLRFRVGPLEEQTAFWTFRGGLTRFLREHGHEPRTDALKKKVLEQPFLVSLLLTRTPAGAFFPSRADENH